MQNNNNNTTDNRFFSPSVSPTTSSPFRHNLQTKYEEDKPEGSDAEMTKHKNAQFQIENFEQIKDIEEMQSLRKNFLDCYYDFGVDYFIMKSDWEEELLNCETEADIQKVIEKIADDTFADYMDDYSKNYRWKNRAELFSNFCNSKLLEAVNEARDYFAKIYTAMTNHINKLDAAISLTSEPKGI